MSGAVSAALLALAVPSHAQPTPAAIAPASITTYARGLNDPRGLIFGPDAILYVAEAGGGGASSSTVGSCPQIEAPVGPFLAGFSLRDSPAFDDWHAARASRVERTVGELLERLAGVRLGAGDTSGAVESPDVVGREGHCSFSLSGMDRAYGDRRCVA
jgi:hypothetical protein